MRGIIYLNRGTRYLVRLLVSLQTLRKHHPRTPVGILVPSNDPGIPLCRRVADAFNARVIVMEISPVKHFGCRARATVWAYSPWKECLVLDSDTVIMGALDELWPQEREIVITHAGDFRTHTHRVRDAEMDAFDIELCEMFWEKDRPCIDTGVMAFHTDNLVLQQWEKMIIHHPHKGGDDEALEILSTLYSFRVAGPEYNCLVGTCHVEKPVLLHYYKNRHLNPTARDQWEYPLQECLRENTAGVLDWFPAGDPFLQKL